MAVGVAPGAQSVLAFWFIYILTRPLGASIGDYLSQPSDQGGLGLGATLTSLIFLAGIVGIVVYLSITKADVIPSSPAAVEKEDAAERGGLWQTVAVVALVLIGGGTGYVLRTSSLAAADAPVPAARGSGSRRPGGRGSSGRRQGCTGGVTPGRSLVVPRDHAGHPGPPELRRPGGRHGPRRRPRARVGQRPGASQAEEQGRVDRGRRQDRHGAPRAPVDQPEPGEREGGADGTARRAWADRPCTGRPIG